MTKLFRAVLLAATMLAPIPALAQESPPSDTEADSPDAQEIVVTARKTEERLQDAPVSVAVATAETIDRLGLDSIADLSKTTSGIVFDDSFGRDANRPVIRGQANILGQSGVAFFIDGIYYSGSLADYDVDTIERVEVVKGPQSALYGRNTYSGAINIISKMPGERWEGRAIADISENDRYEFTANIRGPITDGLGLALGARYYDFGGEFTNQFDGRKVGRQSTKSAFGVLTYDAGGPFSASLRANYNDTDDGQPAIFAQSANLNNCFPDNGALYRGQRRYFCGVIRPQPINTDFRRQFADPEDVGLEARTLNTAFRMDYEFTDQLTLTSLTGYNKRKADTNTDGDYSAESFQQVIFASFPAGPGTRGLVNSTQDFTFSNRNETEDFSQELRLRYEGDDFQLLLGGYYFDQSDNSFDTRVVPADALARAQVNAAAAAAAFCRVTPGCVRTFFSTPVATPNSRNTNFFDVTNKAVFGSVTVDLTDTISISAEGRYAEEEIRQETRTFNEGATPPAPTIARVTFKEFTPRITADWQVTPDNLIYAVYAEGQKPGGFNGNQAIAAGFPTYDPEDVKSYEIGLKNSFLDGRLTANLALYHNEISGYQITQNVSVPPNQVSLIRNAGNAEVDGFELELSLRPDRHVTVTANYAYADSSFTSGTDENQGLIDDVADDRLVNCSLGDEFPSTTGCQSLYGSIVGNRIPRAPVHTVFADLDYRTPLGSGDWSFFAGGNVNLISSSFDQVLNLAKTGGSVVVDARIGAQSDRFKVQLYVKNLFDEDAVAQIIRYADANNDLRRNFIAGLRPGRRFGVILSAGF